MGLQRHVLILIEDCELQAEGSALDLVGTGKPRDAWSWGVSEASKAVLRKTHLAAGWRTVIKG